MHASHGLFVRTGWILLTALPAVAISPSTAAAHDPLRCELKKAAEELRDFFTGRRIKEVAVGDVTNADPTTPSSSGPGIPQVLIQELERAELRVRLRMALPVAATRYCPNLAPRDC